MKNYKIPQRFISILPLVFLILTLFAFNAIASDPKSSDMLHDKDSTIIPIVSSIVGIIVGISTNFGPQAKQTRELQSSAVQHLKEIIELLRGELKSKAEEIEQLKEERKSLQEETDELRRKVADLENFLRS